MSQLGTCVVFTKSPGQKYKVDLSVLERLRIVDQGVEEIKELLKQREFQVA